MIVELKHKGGFYALSDVVVLTSDGAPFYAAKSGRRFNLPKGIYSIAGDVERIEPVEQCIAIYPIEREDRRYNEIRIFVVKNPNKATVIFEKGVCLIFIDEKIAQLPEVCIRYAIEHEKAHAYYKRQPGETHEENENKCDLYAENILLDEGFNPSQLEVANKLLLQSGFRKNKCSKRLKENFGR